MADGENHRRGPLRLPPRHVDKPTSIRMAGHAPHFVVDNLQLSEWFRLVGDGYQRLANILAKPHSRKEVAGGSWAVTPLDPPQEMIRLIRPSAHPSGGYVEQM